MHPDIAIKVSLGMTGDVFETFDDCLHVEHYQVADPNIFLAKITRENGSRAITTSLSAGAGTFILADRDSELRLKQKGCVLYQGVLIEDSIAFIEGSDPISVELQSDACLYVLTFLRQRHSWPCPVIGGRFNIRDERLSEMMDDVSESSAGRRGELAREFSTLAFERYQSLPRVHPLSTWRLNRVRRHAEARLDQRLPLEELADVAGFSRAHFAATFKAATSMSAHEFLLRLRIQEAVKLLLGTDLPLVDIALQCGFQNQPHFTTVFKKMTSVTPRRWRNARRGLPTPSVPGLRRPNTTAIDLPVVDPGRPSHELH